MLLPAINYSQCMHRRRQNVVPNRVGIGRSSHVVADAGICILHLVQFPQRFETQDSEWTRSSFIRASGWSWRGLATDEIGESPKWREWEIWRALGD